MYTSATVREIKNDGTVIVSCSTEACNSCKAQMFCNNKTDTSYTARNDNGITLKNGDRVELFLPPRKTVGSTLLVFALPLAFFPFGYLAMKYFTVLNELFCALGGLVAMSLVFALCSLLGIKNKRALMPVVVKVVE